MYRQFEEIDICMYNIYSNNKFARKFTTKWFSQYNGFHHYRISEYTGNFFKRKTVSKSAP